MEASLEECIRCGACCFSESPRHARVTGDDYERLGTDAERLVVFLGNQAFMQLTGDEGTRRCAALIVDPRTGSFTCSVYERRPTVCRDLERGSGGCAGERAAKHQRTRRALRVLEG
jgi:Fe-S-cluster containining protein